jgi:hypothetical protein
VGLDNENFTGHAAELVALTDVVLANGGQTVSA